MHIKIRHLVLALSVSSLAACSSVQQPATYEAVYIPSSKISTTTVTSYGSDDVLFQAMGLIGTPYRFGGNSPDTGLDCSGLIVYVYREALGIKLPRTTMAMSQLGAPSVSRNSLREGDLVFFATHGKGRVSHAGIYVGDGRFLHAPSRGKNVRIDSLDNTYWNKAYLSAKRIIGTEFASR